MSGDNLLGDFLKSRRARVRVQQAAVTSYGRRRVPGLRRDELAALAGVSVHYLTRLEQGIDRHPSEQVLQALATALRLGQDETAHLRALAFPTLGPQPPGEVPDDVRDLLDSWEHNPAYVHDRRFDVLAANKLAMALSPLYTPGQNLVRGIFTTPGIRTLFPDWADIAHQTTAALRAEADLRDPATRTLLESMLTDDTFRTLWETHDVRRMRNELKRFDHPAVGPLTLRRQALTAAGADGQVIISYQAEPGSATAAALARLI
ncbi:helix-turn-helix transcriptional regulator [Actinoplanes sp. N902-109]|uniref:helix-turn-helix transcriptional regulator n=1 Tax=Actinoplanes sp. (strain N902-109) TaxID=649831 RepID=UPI00032951FE|nr:helix-turn-helix transcriptional regulator [Actinoplanes sp. N902-109]AGL16242.1 XRE family transcriptional regulator [Actinoplanes sp. N902-109]